MFNEHALHIYTNGSSKPSPRKGGVGIRYIYFDNLGNQTIVDLPLPGYIGATNNEMELNACILGLKHSNKLLALENFDRINIYTDSNYVFESYKSAMFLWSKNGWKKKGGAPVLNAVLWKELIKEIKKSRKYVELFKVKGHSKDENNKAVDRLSKISALNPSNKPLTIRIIRRKKSKEHTQIGSVEILGQRIAIHIIQGEYLKLHHLYRYRYEVISKNSPFIGKVDFICSEEILKEGHTYSVRFNSEKNNPLITKVYKELSKGK